MMDLQYRRNAVRSPPNPGYGVFDFTREGQSDRPSLYGFPAPSMHSSFPQMGEGMCKKSTHEGHDIQELHMSVRRVRHEMNWMYQNYVDMSRKICDVQKCNLDLSKKVEEVDMRLNGKIDLLTENLLKVTKMVEGLCENRSISNGKDVKSHAVGGYAGQANICTPLSRKLGLIGRSITPPLLDQGQPSLCDITEHDEPETVDDLLGHEGVTPDDHDPDCPVTHVIKEEMGVTQGGQEVSQGNVSGPAGHQPKDPACVSEEAVLQVPPEFSSGEISQAEMPSVQAATTTPPGGKDNGYMKEITCSPQQSFDSICMDNDSKMQHGSKEDGHTESITSQLPETAYMRNTTIMPPGGGGSVSVSNPTIMPPGGGGTVNVSNPTIMPPGGGGTFSASNATGMLPGGGGTSHIRSVTQMPPGGGGNINKISASNMPPGCQGGFAQISPPSDMDNIHSDLNSGECMQYIAVLQEERRHLDTLHLPTTSVIGKWALKQKKQSCDQELSRLRIEAIRRAAQMPDKVNGSSLSLGWERSLLA